MPAVPATAAGAERGRCAAAALFGLPAACGGGRAAAAAGRAWGLVLPPAPPAPAPIPMPPAHPACRLPHPQRGVPLRRPHERGQPEPVGRAGRPVVEGAGLLLSSRPPPLCDPCAAAGGAAAPPDPLFDCFGPAARMHLLPHLTVGMGSSIIPRPMHLFCTPRLFQPSTSVSSTPFLTLHCHPATPAR